MNNRAKHTKKAFTLIELLVVMTIIALLVSILLPALSKARSQGKRVLCMANQHQIALAGTFYTVDNSDKFNKGANQGFWDNAYTNPREVKEYALDHSKAYWGIGYKKYTDGKAVFHCPEHKRVDDWPELGSDYGEKLQPYFYYSSYALNQWVVEQLGTRIKRHDDVIFTQDHIEQKVESGGYDTLAIRESVGPINLLQWRKGDRKQDKEYANLVSHNVATEYWQDHDCVQEVFRHANTCVLAFLDGHTEVVKETLGEAIPIYWYTTKPYWPEDKGN